MALKRFIFASGGKLLLTDDNRMVIWNEAYDITKGCCPNDARLDGVDGSGGFCPEGVPTGDCSSQYRMYCTAGCHFMDASSIQLEVWNWNGISDDDFNVLVNGNSIGYLSGIGGCWAYQFPIPASIIKSGLRNTVAFEVTKDNGCGTAFQVFVSDGNVRIYIGGGGGHFTIWKKC